NHCMIMSLVAMMGMDKTSVSQNRSRNIAAWSPRSPCPQWSSWVIDELLLSITACVPGSILYPQGVYRRGLDWRVRTAHGKLGRDHETGMEHMTAQVAIVCDRCGDIGTVGPTPQEARDALPHWIRRRGQDLCPVCRAIDEAMRRNGHHQRPSDHEDETPAIGR